MLQFLSIPRPRHDRAVSALQPANARLASWFRPSSMKAQQLRDHRESKERQQDAEKHSRDACRSPIATETEHAGGQRKHKKGERPIEHAETPRSLCRNAASAEAFHDDDVAKICPACGNRTIRLVLSDRTGRMLA